MDVNELRSLRPELDGLMERYLPLFGREENHSHASIFVQGLLAKGERRNVENIAESMEGGVVRTLQKLISQAVWDDRAVLDELREHMKEELAHDEGVVNVDETGFPKKGTKSVGVKRQYAGTLGRTDNCQVGVFLNYYSAEGHVLFDRRVFLPEEWAADPVRRKEAGVPENVVFRTKPELALGMLQEAVRGGLAFRWVGGDGLYGDSPTFVQGVRALRKWYVLDSSADAHVWLEAPTVRRPGEPGRRGGRPATRIKAVEKPRPLSEVLKTIPASEWRRVTVAEGSQGPRVYEYVERTVWFSEGGSPAEQPERLLIRRSVDQQADVKFQRSNAPASVLLQRLAEVGGCRWTIEEGFQCGKGECGLDEYEARGWIAWHHHTALSLLALWFLTQQRRRLGKKRTADDRPRSPRSAATSTRSAAVERTRNPRVVGLAARTQHLGKSLPQASPRPSAARVK